MATVERFEDLLCFKKARELAKHIYKTFKECGDYGFKDQIQRAAVSVASNIAEGFESGTKLEFLNYLYIAKASAGEVRAQLYVALDIGYLNIQTFKDLSGLAEECSKLTASFIKGLQGSKYGGLQFKTVPKKSWTQKYLEENFVRLENGKMVTKEEFEQMEAENPNIKHSKI